MIKNINTHVLDKLGWEVVHDLIVDHRLVDIIYTPEREVYKKSGLMLTLSDVRIDYTNNISLAGTLLEGLPSFDLHRCNGNYIATLKDGTVCSHERLEALFCLIFILTK